MNPSIIHFDNNGTTPLDPRVLNLMIEELSAPPLNPSSRHTLGREGKAKLLQARKSVASFFGAQDKEIFFTSGGTEGMNLLIFGLLTPLEGSPQEGLERTTKKHIVTSSTEHSCVLASMEALKKWGYEVTLLDPEPSGLLSLEKIKDSLTDQTALLILSAANHEIGSLLDLEGAAKIASSKGVPLIVDGVALLGKASLSIPEGVTGMAFSGHKIHAPKGSGCIYLKKNTPLSPLFYGGGQEMGKRSGTENLPAIIAFAKSLSILQKDFSAIQSHLLSLRSRFEKRLIEMFPQIEINGTDRVSNLSNLHFPGIEAEVLLTHLDLLGITASYGSACSAGALEPSKTLQAMGLPKERVLSSIRFSFSRMNTQEEVDTALERITSLLKKFW